MLFPQKHLEETVEPFKDLQKCKLTTELEVLYSSQDLRKALSVTALLQEQPENSSFLKQLRF